VFAGNGGARARNAWWAKGLRDGVVARFVRFKPLAWGGGAGLALRVEVFGELLASPGLPDAHISAPSFARAAVDGSSGVPEAGAGSAAALGRRLRTSAPLWLEVDLGQRLPVTAVALRLCGRPRRGGLWGAPRGERGAMRGGGVHA